MPAAPSELLSALWTLCGNRPYRGGSRVMPLKESHAYTVGDVFTTEPLAGNPLAVFPAASEFDAVTLQRIARELSLAETAFVLPATRKDCATRVRIFAPAKELAFAEHPTVGTAFALLQKGIVPSDSTDF